MKLKDAIWAWKLAIPYRGTSIVWIRRINRMPLPWRRFAAVINWAFVRRPNG